MTGFEIILPVASRLDGVTAASAVSDVVSIVMTTISSITANPLVAAAVAIPLTAGAISLAKRLFKRG